MVNWYVPSVPRCAGTCLITALARNFFLYGDGSSVLIIVPGSTSVKGMMRSFVKFIVRVADNAVGKLHCGVCLELSSLIS